MPEVADLPLTKKYYKKEIVTSPLYFKAGGRVQFEVVGGDIGLLATEDTELIKNLEAAIARRMGGVVAITADEYEELKKNPPEPRSKRSSLKPWRQAVPSNQGQGEADAAVEVNKTASIKVPDKEPLLAQLADLKKPKQGKLSDLMDRAKEVTQGS